MSYVVDASVAVKWFVKENLREKAIMLRKYQERLSAPDIIVPEMTNIAWKKVIRDEITAEQAFEIARTIRQAPLTFHSSVALNEKALQIALELAHPIYDCLYIACAETADGVLVTADQRLCNAVRATGFAPLVRYLGDPTLFAAPSRP